MSEKRMYGETEKREKKRGRERKRKKELKRKILNEETIAK